MHLTIVLTFLLALALPSPAAARTTLAFPTAATTGALYPLGAGMANLWNESIPDLAVRAQASNGGLQNLNLLMSGEVQISFAVSSVAYQALHGQGVFKGREWPGLRVLAGLYYNPNQVVVRGDSKITSLTGLKGQRFASGAPGSTTEVETHAHFTTAGLNYPEDVRVQYVGFTEAIDLMRNRQLDGAWIMAGTPTAAVTEMCATAEGRLLSFEPNLVKLMRGLYPWYVPYTIPAGTYPGQTEPVQTTAVKMLLLVDVSLPDELAYKLTRVLWENLPVLTNVHPVMATVDKKQAVSDLAGLPLHPGAEKYYHEAGLL